jgi:hypothetical protein
MVNARFVFQALVNVFQPLIVIPFLNFIQVSTSSSINNRISDMMGQFGQANSFFVITLSFFYFSQRQ